MAQIFRPGTNTLASISVALGAVAPLGIILLLSGITRAPYNTQVDVPLEQPVPFSHEHHVNELGIDCRYCHSSVEKSHYAGIPPTHTCMSCHSQIWTNSPLLEPVRESYATGVPLKWNKVYDIPDFVYFNHSIHIKKGVSCNVCHGAIHRQQITARARPFQMRWCLECHRNPEKYIIPTGDIFELYHKIQSGEDLTPYEQKLASGEDVLDVEGVGKHLPPDPERIAEGTRLLKEYHINKKQLTDCSICHR